MARALAELGAIIAAVDQNAAGVSRLVDELVHDGYRTAAFPRDVSHRAAVDETVKHMIPRKIGFDCHGGLCGSSISDVYGSLCSFKSRFGDVYQMLGIGGCLPS